MFVDYFEGSPAFFPKKFLRNESFGSVRPVKFGLIKALLDNIHDGQKLEQGVFLTYEQIFCAFAENYWKLVIKYDLRQMRKDGKSIYSKVETILKSVVKENKLDKTVEFKELDFKIKNKIIKEVSKECKTCVVGALYEDFEGIIYSFDLKDNGLCLNQCVYEYMLNNQIELERLNNCAWISFLEKINDFDELEVDQKIYNTGSIRSEILCDFVQVKTVEKKRKMCNKLV